MSSAGGSVADVVLAEYCVVSMAPYASVNSLLSLALTSWRGIAALKPLIAHRLRQHDTGGVPRAPRLKDVFLFLSALFTEIRNEKKRELDDWGGDMYGYEVESMQVDLVHSPYRWKVMERHCTHMTWNWLGHGVRKEDNMEVVLWIRSVHEMSLVGPVTLVLLVPAVGPPVWQLLLKEYQASLSDNGTVIVGAPQRASCKGLAVAKPNSDPSSGPPSPNDFIPFTAVSKGRDLCSLLDVLLAGDGGGLTGVVQEMSGELVEACRCLCAEHPVIWEVEAVVGEMTTHKGVAKFDTGTCTAVSRASSTLLSAIEAQTSRMVQYSLKHSAKLLDVLRQIIPCGVVKLLTPS